MICELKDFSLRQEPQKQNDLLVNMLVVNDGHGVV